LVDVIAARQKDDAVSRPVEGLDRGSISMLAVCVGPTVRGTQAPSTNGR
jgi:hypothetical protein